MTKKRPPDQRHGNAHPLNNEDAFDVLTDEAAYWAGMLTADGCVGDNCRISLFLQEADSDHIYKWQRFIGASAYKVLHSESSFNGNVYRKAGVAVTSRYLAHRLAELGITSRKTFTACAPPELALNKFFWLGAIDGDGGICISNNVPTIHLAGTEELVSQFISFIGTYLTWRLTSASKKGNIWTTTLHGRKAFEVIEFLWSGHDLGLTRKRIKAETVLQDYASLPAVKDKPNWSKYRGVSALIGRGLKKPYYAKCGEKWLGYFSTGEEAAQAYNVAAKELYGDGAKLNDVVGTGEVEQRSDYSDPHAASKLRVERVAQARRDGQDYKEVGVSFGIGSREIARLLRVHMRRTGEDLRRQNGYLRAQDKRKLNKCCGAGSMPVMVAT